MKAASVSHLHVCMCSAASSHGVSEHADDEEAQQQIDRLACSSLSSCCTSSHHTGSRCLLLLIRHSNLTEAASSDCRRRIIFSVQVKLYVCSRLRPVAADVMIKDCADSTLGQHAVSWMQACTTLYSYISRQHGVSAAGLGLRWPGEQPTI